MKKTFTKILCLAVAVFAVSVASAQQGYEKCNEVFRLGVEARFDYINQALAGDKLADASGFKVRYFNLRMDGQITPKFTYSWRQRFNRANSISEFAQNTDWLHLTFRPSKNWAFSAGKQVVMIGGWEYDRAPIDLYFCSEYWNNIACYQLGASAAYITADGRDRIMAQVCESPFTTHRDYMFAYNLMWYGNHDWFNSIYSLNASEYQPGKYIYYIVLGNQFKFDNFRVQLDLMNRATSEHAFFFKDFSVMCELSYNVKDKFNVFGKVSYDINDSGVEGDYCVLPGTEMTRIGAGAEYFPLSNGRKDLRLFAYYSYSWGVNGNPTGALQDRQNLWGVGVKWNIDILSLTSKIFKKNEKAEI